MSKYLANKKDTIILKMAFLQVLERSTIYQRNEIGTNELITKINC